MLGPIVLHPEKPAPAARSMERVLDDMRRERDTLSVCWTRDQLVLRIAHFEAVMREMGRLP